MHRFIITHLAVVAGLLAAAPAIAHGSHAGDGQPSMATVSSNSNHETRELQNKVNELNKDIKQDNKKLTMDQQKVQVLEMQAAEAKAGKAPPLSRDQERELKELLSRMGKLDRDIGRDNQHLAADQVKLNAWQEKEAP